MRLQDRLHLLGSHLPSVVQGIELNPLYDVSHASLVHDLELIKKKENKTIYNLPEKCIQDCLD